MKTTLLAVLIAGSAFAQAPADGPVVTVRGSLSADGKPVPTAEFYLGPASGQTVVQVEPSGAFEVRGVASRTYAVTVRAPGFASLHQTVELDAKGVGDLGPLKLERLRKAKLTVLVGPVASLERAPRQRIEVTDGACATVRAQDDSGCRFSFCVTQVGRALKVNQDLQSLGRGSLDEALARLPKGTVVSGLAEPTTLVAGEAFAVDTHDAYCAGALVVDEIKVRAAE